VLLAAAVRWSNGVRMWQMLLRAVLGGYGDAWANCEFGQGVVNKRLRHACGVLRQAVHFIDALRVLGPMCLAVSGAMAGRRNGVSNEGHPSHSKIVSAGLLAWAITQVPIERSNESRRRDATQCASTVPSQRVLLLGGWFHIVLLNRGGIGIASPARPREGRRIAGRTISIASGERYGSLLYRTPEFECLTDGPFPAWED
jgi:hypothetical protein